MINNKLEPVTCVTWRRSLAAINGINAYAIMPYAAVHVPAGWAPARHLMKTLVPRKMAFDYIRYNFVNKGKMGTPLRW